MHTLWNIYLGFAVGGLIWTLITLAALYVLDAGHRLPGLIEWHPLCLVRNPKDSISTGRATVGEAIFFTLLSFFTLVLVLFALVVLAYSTRGCSPRSAGKPRSQGKT